MPGGLKLDMSDLDDLLQTHAPHLLDPNLYGHGLGSSSPQVFNATSPPPPSFAKPGPYKTDLGPDEPKFQSWVKSNNIPWQDGPTSDYDMRGYWKAQQGGDANARTEVNSVDHKPHYPDTYKTPFHKSFSNESQYSLPGAPHWEGQNLVSSQAGDTAFSGPSPRQPFSAVPSGSFQPTSPELGTGIAPPTMSHFGTPASIAKPTHSEDMQARTSQLRAGGPDSNFYRDQIAEAEDKKQNPWGSPDNHPGFLGKVAHGLARAGNIAGDILAPGTTALIPGTDLNNQAKERHAESELGQAETRETNAGYKDALAANAANKTDIQGDKVTETNRHNQATEALGLRAKGLQKDEDGLISEIPYERMTPAEQAHIDLQKSQKELTDARAEYEQTKADPNSPQNKAALGRLKVAAQNASTAAGKLGLNEKEFSAKYLGLGPDGKPLVGAQTDEQGRTIGPSVANSGATSAKRLDRSDLARNVEVNAKSLKENITQNPDLFGKLAGRFTTTREMIGSDDPAIRKIGVAVHNMALASNGAHGIRSAEAVKDTENLILNHFKDGIEATNAGVDELVHSVQTFREDANHGKRPNNSDQTPARPSGVPADATWDSATRHWVKK